MTSGRKTPETTARQPTAQGSEAPAANPRTLESAALLSGQVEVCIRHNGRVYRLRATRLGKLILTA